MRNDSDAPFGEGDNRDGSSRRPPRRGRSKDEGTRAAPTASASDDDTPRAPLPRHELLNPKPIPGRLLEDKKPDLSELLRETPSEQPARDPDDDSRPPRRRRRRSRGGRRRDEPDAGKEEDDPMEKDTATIEAPEPAARPAEKAVATARRDDDDFGAGIFDEPAKARVRRPKAEPVAEERAPEPAAPEPEAEPEEPDDGFGIGIL